MESDTQDAIQKNRESYKRLAQGGDWVRGNWILIIDETFVKQSEDKEELIRLVMVERKPCYLVQFGFEEYKRNIDSIR